MTGSLKMARLDFISMKTQLASYFSLVFILIMFAFMDSSFTLLGINGAWFMALMSINVFAVQEKNNMEHLYGSLSIKWKDVIAGRYLSILASYAASFVLVILVYLGFSLYQNKGLTLSEAAVGLSMSFLIFSAIIGIEIPMLFRMGYTKARAWALLPYLVVIGLAFTPSFVTLFLNNNETPSFPSLLSEVNKLINLFAANPSILIIGGLLAGAAIQYLSYKTSVVFYRKKR